MLIINFIGASHLRVYSEGSLGSIPQDREKIKMNELSGMGYPKKKQEMRAQGMRAIPSPNLLNLVALWELYT